MNNSGYLTPELIVFGTHLSEKHGYTLSQIEKEGFKASFCIEDTVPDNDTPQSISICIGNVVKRFADFWNCEKFDIVFALGDRFEMFAACIAGVPFGLRIAHIHGGEKTEGAIDDALRHSITHMSKFHFTATELYKERVVRLKESDQNVFNVGALSMDNLSTLSLYTIEEMYAKFGIDLTIPTILVTFHPETSSFNKNKEYIDIILNTLEKLNDFQIVITMPNSDTMGNMIRSHIENFSNKLRHPKLVLIESFGTLGYYSCMKYCKLMLGNTSSGFGEASYFPKPVINLGRRQEGRILTPNIFQTEIKEQDILNSIHKAVNYKPENSNVAVYGSGGAAKKIIEILTHFRNGL